MQSPTQTAKKPQKTIAIVINNVERQVPDGEMTPRELLALVGDTPETHELLLVKGKRERESYKDRPDDPIRLHPGIEFISVSLGATPVS
ncbi:MAG: hypothetical protein WKF96_16050 [Solirubrobacteraceae bacterium]